MEPDDDYDYRQAQAALMEHDAVERGVLSGAERESFRVNQAMGYASAIGWQRNQDDPE